MTSIDTDDDETFIGVAVETDVEPLQSIWDCHVMSKIVDSITKKPKMECLHCGMFAVWNSTKLVCHDAKKKGGEIRMHTTDH